MGLNDSILSLRPLTLEELEWHVDIAVLHLKRRRALEGASRDDGPPETEEGERVAPKLSWAA
jgi:hypothetical protein